MRRTIGIGPRGEHILVNIPETLEEKLDLEKQQEMREFQEWRRNKNSRWSNNRRSFQ